MTTPDQDPRVGQVRQADVVLRALLRTPKTREGLIAAVTNTSITRNYVFGWLATQRRTGALIQDETSGVRTYRIVGEVVPAASTESPYPAWLEPRSLPTATGRRILLEGKEIQV